MAMHPSPVVMISIHKSQPLSNVVTSPPLQQSNDCGMNTFQVFRLGISSSTLSRFAEDTAASLNHSLETQAWQSLDGSISGFVTKEGIVYVKYVKEESKPEVELNKKDAAETVLDEEWEFVENEQKRNDSDDDEAEWDIIDEDWEGQDLMEA